MMNDDCKVSDEVLVSVEKNEMGELQFFTFKCLIVI